jgi:ATP-dependent DNA ligase
MTTKCKLYAFDILALDGDDLRSLPLSMRKTNLGRLLARRIAALFSTVSFSSPSFNSAAARPVTRVISPSVGYL